MSLVVIDHSSEAESHRTAKLSLDQISISAGSQAVIHAQQHTAVAKDTGNRIDSRDITKED